MKRAFPKVLVFTVAFAVISANSTWAAQPTTPAPRGPRPTSYYCGLALAGALGLGLLYWTGLFDGEEPAKQTAEKTTGLAFLPVTHPAVPPAVRTASASVFRLVPVLESDPQETAKATWNEYAQSRPFGSAFLVGNGDLLVTVMHTFDKTKFGGLIAAVPPSTDDRWMRSADALRAATPTFLLYGQDGKLAFDSRVDGAYVTALSPVVRPLAVRDAGDRMDAVISDFVGFRLGRSLGRGLVLAPEGRPRNVAALGFPAIVNDRYVRDFRVSLGPTLAAQQWLNLALDEGAQRELDQQALVTGARVTPGMSGGPLVDEEGRVLGPLGLILNFAIGTTIVLSPERTRILLEPRRIQAIGELLRP